MGGQRRHGRAAERACNGSYCPCYGLLHYDENPGCYGPFYGLLHYDENPACYCSCYSLLHYDESPACYYLFATACYCYCFRIFYSLLLLLLKDLLRPATA